MGGKAMNTIAAAILLTVLLCMPLCVRSQDAVGGNWKGFRFLCKEADGNQGYYVTRPEVTVIHQDAGTITGYRVDKPDGTRAEGLLTQPDESVQLREELQEGSQVISVWMEDMEGRNIPGYLEQKEIVIDSQAPELSISAPEGFEAWYDGDVPIQVQVQDTGGENEVKQVRCYVDGELVKRTEENLVFIIQKESKGGAGVSVRVEAEDPAGNTAVEENQLYIDKSEPRAAIVGIGDFEILDRSAQIRCQVEEENVLETLEWKVHLENPDGTVVSINDAVWEEESKKKVLVQHLSKDGIYRMELKAVDQAGHTILQKAQVLLDQATPVIRYVENIKGRVLREFYWNHKVQEAIADFTTYRYDLKLDGKQYQPGEKNKKEGVHTFSVQAVDEAGNKAEVSAEFVIDRTKPQILVKGVKQGKTYRKDAEVAIQPKNKKDWIEAILINGESQKLSAGSKVYLYTLQNPGKYEVKITAKDLAGNIKEEVVVFAIREKRTLFQMTAAPMQIVLAVLIAAAAVVVWWCKRGVKRVRVRKTEKPDKPKPP